MSWGCFWMALCGDCHSTTSLAWSPAQNFKITLRIRRKGWEVIQVIYTSSFYMSTVSWSTHPNSKWGPKLFFDCATRNGEWRKWQFNGPQPWDHGTPLVGSHWAISSTAAKPWTSSFGQVSLVRWAGSLDQQKKENLKAKQIRVWDITIQILNMWVKSKSH